MTTVLVWILIAHRYPAGFLEVGPFPNAQECALVENQVKIISSDIRTRCIQARKMVKE